MKVKGLEYKYCLVFGHDKVIRNPENFKDKINEKAEVEIYDTFGTAIGFNSLKQLEKYIKDNNLTFPDEQVEINPFDSEWDPEYSNANVRMFIDAINAMLLAIEQPEFIMLLKQRNIKLIVDENYGGTWVYLEEIEQAHKLFLEADRSQGGYNARFESRDI